MALSKQIKTVLSLQISDAQASQYPTIVCTNKGGDV